MKAIHQPTPRVLLIASALFSLVCAYAAVLAGGEPAGDVDGRGTLSLDDAASIAASIISGTPSSNSDCNGDGSTNILDVVCVVDQVISVPLDTDGDGLSDKVERDGRTDPSDGGDFPLVAQMATVKKQGEIRSTASGITVREGSGDVKFQICLNQASPMGGVSLNLDTGGTADPGRRALSESARRHAKSRSMAFCYPPVRASLKPESQTG